jgi:phospholipase/carboxylesterase
MISNDHPERLATLLRDAGADVTFRWEDAGHKLTQADLFAARDWLAERFGT